MSTEEKINRYASQKSISQKLLNIAIIQSHIALIIGVTDSEYLTESEIGLIVLASMSLALQFIMFGLLVYLLYIKPSYRPIFCRLAIYPEVVNGVITVLSAFILVVDLTITALVVKNK